MSNKNERINEHIIEAQMKTIRDQTGNRDFPPGNRHLAYGLVVNELLTELKRCYEEIDALQGKIDSAHEAMKKYSNEEIDNVCDAYEAVCMAL